MVSRPRSGTPVVDGSCVGVDELSARCAFPTQASLRMLGVGASDALHSPNTNALIERPRGRVLLDCGYTAMSALASLGLSFTDISDVVIGLDT